MKVDTDGVWVAVKVGGKNHWLFNVMDSDTRFLLSAYLSPTRTTRAAAMPWALARQRSNNPPRQVKTDGLASYRDAVPRAFPTHPVKPVGSKGIRTQINNNLSERLQGTIRDRDKTLRGPKAPETGQAYVDGLVTHYNPVYFRPHESLTGSGRWKPRARNCRLAVGRMWRRCNPAKGAEMGKYRTFPYYGGKRGYGKAEWIAFHRPWDTDSCYVEPFAGMASVLFARSPSNERC